MHLFSQGALISKVTYRLIKSPVHCSTGLQTVAAVPSDTHVTDAPAQSHQEWASNVFTRWALYACRAPLGDWMDDRGHVGVLL